MAERNVPVLQGEHEEGRIEMNRKLPISQGSFSRRDFLRGSSIGLAAAMTSRYGLTMAQDVSGIPQELIPGSPGHPRGWTTTLPPIPEGMPVSPPVTISGSRRAPWEFAEGDDIENSPFTRLRCGGAGH